MIRTAVILAAGTGSRLKDITKDRPKGFISIGGKPVIKLSIEKLFDAGIAKIIIGTGFLSDMYEQFAQKYPGIECIKNPAFKDTGSMRTLYSLRRKIDSDFLLLESDLLYEKRGLRILLEDTHEDVILSSRITFSGDEVFIEVDKGGYLVKMSKKIQELGHVHSELVGISKISLRVFKKMCGFAETAFPDNPKLDYEYAMVGISQEAKIFVRKEDDLIWGEIDNADHLRKARQIIYPKIRGRESNVKCC